MSNVLDMTLPEATHQALQAHAKKVREAKAAYDQARAERERDIRAAAEDGGKYREIADAAGVAYQRVGQIITGHKPPAMSFEDNRNVPCPTCGAKAGEPCRGKVGIAGHADRAELAYAQFVAAHPEVA